MTPTQFRKLALSLDGVTEVPHMERAGFRTKRKIFATLGDDERVNLVVQPAERREALLESYPEVFVTLGGWTRLGYVAVDLAKADAGLLRELLEDAWRDAQPATKRRSPARKAPAKSKIDDYLATVAGDKRFALEKLRETIRALVPNAEECISYGLPAFRLDGKVVAGFQATAKGCSYYPFSGTTLQALAADLEGYSQTKSALHFRPEKPLPVALVRKLVKARIKEPG